MNDLKQSVTAKYIITAVAIATAVIFVLFAFLIREKYFLPGFIEWKDKTVSDEGTGIEVKLSNREVLVTLDDEIIFQSSDGVKVQDVLVCDVDRNGTTELVLLCWKRGKYGMVRPFWIERDDNNWSQHVYIYDIFPDKRLVKPKWMASEIGLDVYGFSFEDGNLILEDTDGIRTTWRWVSWGLERIYPEVRIIAAGDNIIHTAILNMAAENDMSFDFAYERINELIGKGDISVVVQETPAVTDMEQVSGDYPVFGTPHQVVTSLAKAGFNVAALATNHVMDRGCEGIDSTKEAFADSNITVIGIDNDYDDAKADFEVVEANGIRVALLDYTYGLNGNILPDDTKYHVNMLMDKDEVACDIRRAKKESDAVVVFVHWGDEYCTELNTEQEEYTQLFLEEGVDAVVGSHPHVVQRTQMITGENGHRMLVYYSLGNFYSAQRRSGTDEGIVADFTIVKRDEGCEVVSWECDEITTVYEEGRAFVTLK